MDNFRLDEEEIYALSHLVIPVRLAIVGAGVAGSYLANRLYHNDHDVEVFEESRQESHWPICAWGASRHMLEKFSSEAGLEFGKYILHRGQRLRMELPAHKTEYLDLSGLVTYDKKRWEKDLLGGLKVHFGAKCLRSSTELQDFDYIIDCTGVHRSLLPRCERDFMIPAYEFLINNVESEREFYVIGYKGARGYFWFFPLGKGMAYVGAGDIDRKYIGVSEFFEQNPSAKILKKIGRPIRLSPPKMMQPFCDDNIIGVGESIGCVFPMLGEGIIPSLICCDIFLDVLNKSSKFDSNRYRDTVLRKFAYYEDVYRIVRLKMEGKLNSIKHIGLLISMYRNMKREEKRFGFEINFGKMKRLVNAL
jgi:flavin-dependent dehydrogenase